MNQLIIILTIFLLGCSLNEPYKKILNEELKLIEIEIYHNVEELKIKSQNNPLRYKELYTHSREFQILVDRLTDSINSKKILDQIENLFQQNSEISKSYRSYLEFRLDEFDSKKAEIQKVWHLKKLQLDYIKYLNIYTFNELIKFESGYAEITNDSIISLIPKDPTLNSFALLFIGSDTIKLNQKNGIITISDSLNIERSNGVNGVFVVIKDNGSINEYQIKN